MEMLGFYLIMAGIFKFIWYSLGALIGLFLLYVFVVAIVKYFQDKNERKKSLEKMREELENIK